ncbi:MAG TPA: VanW family protein, partial [Blastococcus sp.]|nr:VanW family protein [Blastococcus sp.]
MPQQPTTSDDTVRQEPVRTDVTDETVRMRGDGHGGRPAPAAAHPSQPSAEVDDTRPVTRDWLMGAPDANRGEAAAQTGTQTGTQTETRTETQSVPESAPEDDDWQTQAFDRSAPAASPVEAPDATQALDRPDDRSASPSVDVSEGSRGAGSDVPGGPPPGDEPPGRPRGPWWRRRAVLAPVGAVALLGAVYGVDLLVASGDVPRNTVVAGVDIGGLSPAAAASALEEQLAPRVVADHTVVADDVQAPLSPATAGITLNVDGTVDVADDQPLNPWTRLVSLFSEREVDPVITGEDTALNAQIESIALQVDRAPIDATIAIEGTAAGVAPAADGRALDREGAAEAITAALARGGDPATPIELPVDVTEVRVDDAEAQRVLDETVTPALSAPVTIQGSDGTTAEVSEEAIAASLTFTPQDDGQLTVGIDPAALQTALGEELSVFGTPAKDAGFQLNGDTVSVVPSVDGTGIAPDHLAEQLLPVLTTPAPRSVAAELGPVPADLTTEEAQALGIKEEIGSFTTNIGNPNSGENIRVVAAEVDGALVMPGETFSLNEFTGPRGTAQGYVPAGVISGGQFTQAVGGGISQFATTMFNAVFFSGLEDIYHKPHSYYISRYPAGREAT